MTIQRIGGTFSFYKKDAKRKLLYRYYIQFSSKKSWLIPKVERNFRDMRFDLYGWLFFYFGRECVGVLYGEEDKWLFKVEEYEQKKALVNGVKWEIKEGEGYTTLIFYRED